MNTHDWTPAEVRAYVGATPRPTPPTTADTVYTLVYLQAVSDAIYAAHDGDVIIAIECSHQTRRALIKLMDTQNQHQSDIKLRATRGLGDTELIMWSERFRYRVHPPTLTLNWSQL